jgi:hypothetical protein
MIVCGAGDLLFGFPDDKQKRVPRAAKPTYLVLNCLRLREE